MEAIFNRRAKLVAWLDNHSQIIFDLQSKPVAHVANRAVYTYCSAQLGYFDRGFFRDLSGNAVAFIRERSGGPITAIPPASRLAPHPPFAAAPPSPPPAPVMPMATYRWSVLDWDAFVGTVNLRQSVVGRNRIASLCKTGSSETRPLA